jgi:hypothetical protein
MVGIGKNQPITQELRRLPIVVFLLICVSILAYGKQFALDDFNDADAVSAVGTRWIAVTDQVMGGRSVMTTRFENDENERALVVAGRVSLENNGGFIQVRLPLPIGQQDFSDFGGIYLRVRGESGSYSVNVRTPENRRPWSYYSAGFDVVDTWKTVFIPWNQFQGQNTAGRRPDTSNITSIGIVAGNTAFEPELFLSEIGVYR